MRIGDAGRWGARILVGGLLLLGLLLASEAAWRVLPLYAPLPDDPSQVDEGTYYPRAFYRFTREGYSTGRVNAHGLRGRDYPYDRRPGTFRILLYGNSFIEGLQVPEEANLAARLEGDLDAAVPEVDFEVINMARSGDTTAGSYLFHGHEGRKYRADLALLFVDVEHTFLNNLRDTAMERSIYAFIVDNGGLPAVESSFPDNDASITFRLAHRSPLRHLKRSAFFNFLYWRLSRLKASGMGGRGDAPSPAGRAPSRPGHGDLSMFHWPLGDRETRAWSASWALLRHLRDESAADGTRVGVLVYSMPRRSRHPLGDRAFEPELTEQRVIDQARQGGLVTVNLGPAFRAAGDDLFLHGADGSAGHWNEQGHRLAAREAAGQIASLAAEGFLRLSTGAR